MASDIKDDLLDIRESIRDLSRKLDNVLPVLGKLTSMERSIEDFHSKLYGNGQKGLVADVSSLKSERKYRYWISGLLFTFLGAFSAELVKYISFK